MAAALSLLLLRPGRAAPLHLSAARPVSVSAAPAGSRYRPAGILASEALQCTPAGR